MSTIKTSFKFIILDVDGQGISDVASEIQQRSGTPPIIQDTVVEVISQIKNGGLFCIVLSFDDLDEAKSAVLSKIKKASPDSYIFAVASHISNPVLELAKKSKRLLVIERPLTEAKLVGLLCEKIILGLDVFHREHSRHPAKETALFERIKKRETTTGTVLNLSKGGAYVELDKKMTFAPKEPVRLTVKNKKEERVYMAEVAWVAENLNSKDKFGVGIRFISS